MDRTYGVSDTIIPKRMTAVGQVAAVPAKLHWMTMSPTAAASLIELIDSLTAAGAVAWDMTHGVNSAHHMNIMPPMPFATGIYLKTLTNMTSIIFGYSVV